MYITLLRSSKSKGEKRMSAAQIFINNTRTDIRSICTERNRPKNRLSKALVLQTESDSKAVSYNYEIQV